MQLSVNGKQMDVGEALRQYIEENLQTTVEKYFAQATGAQVTVSKHTHNFRVDIQVHIGRRVMVQAQGEGGGAYGAFEEALQHVGTRLRRYKRRLSDHHRRQEGPEVAPAAQYVLQSDQRDEELPVEDNPIIIAEMQTEIETLSVSEAVMRMELVNQPALLFRNAKGGNLNLVYKREDGNIGWIDPGTAR